MFAFITKIFSSDTALDTTRQNAEFKTHLAASVLLLEAAHSDQECTAEEMAHVMATLKAQFAFTDEYLAELLKLAEAEREKSLDLWQFTNQINGSFTGEEKMAVMRAIWRVIFADGQLEAHEDHFAHKLANLLRLTHKQLIEAKVAARESGIAGCGSRI